MTTKLSPKAIQLRLSKMIMGNNWTLYRHRTIGTFYVLLSNPHEVLRVTDDGYIMSTFVDVTELAKPEYEAQEKL
jgi:hypothetical protein